MPFIYYEDYPHSRNSLWLSERIAGGFSDRRRPGNALDIVAVPHISAPPKWDLLDSSETPWLEQLCLDLQPEGFDCRLLLYNHITEVERERLDQGLPHIELAPDKEKEKECKYGITYWATRFVEALLKEREASQDVPIVFFCHGTGGLVLKKALIDLYKIRNSYTSLTRFIVFIATPHYGSIYLTDFKTSMLKMDRGSKDLGLRLSRDVKYELPVASPYLKLLDLAFRIVSMDIPMRCYAEGDETRISDEPPEAAIIVPFPSSQIPQNTQWNGFNDNFDCVLPIGHYDTVFLLGISVYYDSLLHRLIQILSASRNDEFRERQLTSRLLKFIPIHRHELLYASKDNPILLNELYRIKLGYSCGEDCSSQRILTIIDILDEALNVDIDVQARDVQGGQLYDGNTEHVRPIASSTQEAMESSERRREDAKAVTKPMSVNWYHVRYCVGDWVPLLLSAIALKRCMLYVSQDSLTEELRTEYKSSHLWRRPQWQYPGALLKCLSIDIELGYPHEVRPIILYMPYLRRENFSIFQKREKVLRDRMSYERLRRPGKLPQENDEWKVVICRYLFSQLPLSCRRSLDQFGYPYLSDTDERDKDQVVTKLWRIHEKERESAFHVAGGPNEEVANDKNEKEPMLVIDTIWMWLLSKDTVLTFAPASEIERDPLPGDADWEFDLKQHVEKRFSMDCFTFAAMAIHHCVLGTSEESNASLDSVINQYEEYLGYWINDYLSSFRKFRDDKHKKHSELDLDKDIGNLIELKDVIDELQILTTLFEEQSKIFPSIVKELKEHIHIHMHPTTAITILEGTQESLTASKERVQGMLERANKSHEQCDKLITIKQAKGSADEARVATDQARTVTVFTIVTIVFSPLSFFTSFFAMPPAQSQGIGSNLNWVLAIMLPASFVITCIAMLGAYHVQIRQRFGFTGYAKSEDRNGTSLSNPKPVSDVKSSDRKDTISSIKERVSSYRHRNTRRSPQDVESAATSHHRKGPTLFQRAKKAHDSTEAREAGETVTEQYGKTR